MPKRLTMLGGAVSIEVPPNANGIKTLEAKGFYHAERSIIMTCWDLFPPIFWYERSVAKTVAVPVHEILGTREHLARTNPVTKAGGAPHTTDDAAVTADAATYRDSGRPTDDRRNPMVVLTHVVVVVVR